ncbi:cadherin-18-like [Aplochiton taeniatus]
MTPHGHGSPSQPGLDPRPSLRTLPLPQGSPLNPGTLSRSQPKQNLHPDVDLRTLSQSNPNPDLRSQSTSQLRSDSKPLPHSQPSSKPNPQHRPRSPSNPRVQPQSQPDSNPRARPKSLSQQPTPSPTSGSLTSSTSTSTSTRPRLIPAGRTQRNQTKVLEAERDSHHRPKRGWIWNQFFVLEEHMGPEAQYVGKLHSNSDKGDGSVRYLLSGEGAGSIFVIDEVTGDIRAVKSLDRENKAQYVLHAQALDRFTNRSLEPESEFIIKVQDVNDNAPVFPEGPFSATVAEMSDVGTSVCQVTASDADDPTYGNSAKIVYSVLQGQPYFSVDAKTGVIRTALSSLDREAKELFAVVIQAKDMAGSVGGLSGSTTVNVTLTDVNDNPPRFPQRSYQLYVPESAPVGKEVGRVKATDEDQGVNVEMKYSITNSEAAAMFTIATGNDNREGIISLRQPLNYEKRKAHTLHIEAVNTHLDPRFSHLGPFRDSASLRVVVGDVDEPPVFTMDFYILDVYENWAAGTEVGTVTALDPDSTNSAVRYFLESSEEKPQYFTLGVKSGIISTTRSLDREDVAWHNFTVMAAEVDNPRLVSQVPVTIQVLDVNDNVPSVASGDDDVIVCEGTRAGQVSTIKPVDMDNFANGHFSFTLAVDQPTNPNFTLKDNQDNSASLVAVRRRGFVGVDPEERYQLPLVVSDGGDPALSSTVTLTLRVCACLDSPTTRGQQPNSCQALAFLSTAGLSMGAFVAILLCILLLLAIVVLFVVLRSTKAGKDPLMLSEEDVRENVVSYDDEGGGEEDTEAFDIAALRNPSAAGGASQPRQRLNRPPQRPRRHPGVDYGDDEEEEEEEELPGFSPGREPAAWMVIGCVPREASQWSSSVVLSGLDVVHQVIGRKVGEADMDTSGPPYDSLHTYAYEGQGSLTGSVSSLGLAGAVPELKYSDLEDWEPEVKTLQVLFGEHTTQHHV